MKPTVYIETTIVGYLTTRPTRNVVTLGRMEVTRAWWKHRRPDFTLCASDAVLAESGRGDPEAASDRLAVLRGIDLLPTPPEAIRLAVDLIGAASLPTKAATDALHIAVAATSGMNFLLTWNCRHIANATFRPAIERIIRSHGFDPPVICTPSELMEVPNE